MKKRWFFVIVSIAFAAGAVANHYGAYAYDLYALSQLEESLGEMPGLHEAEGEVYFFPDPPKQEHVFPEPPKQEHVFSEIQRRVTMIVAIPDYLVNPDHKKNDELARSLLVRGSEWTYIDPNEYNNANRWLKHTVFIYQPPKTPPPAPPVDKKVVSTTD